MLFAIAMGMLAFAYNTDKYSVKQSMRWMIDLIIGGTDNTEGQSIEERIQAEKQSTKDQKEKITEKYQ